MEPPADIVLVLGGGPLAPEAAHHAATATVVVAADSGVDHALASGLPVHHVVGDLDSASADGVARAEAAGATVHRHPADKDATDSELAVDLVLHLAADHPTQGAPVHLLVLGGGAGRVDHLLADVLALVGSRLEPLEVSASLGEATFTVVRSGRPRVVDGSVGDQLSVLAPAGLARGVTTTGVRWPLVDADLAPASTRAMSNELTEPRATVSVLDGVLLVVQPGTRAPRVDPRATPYDPSPRAIR